MDPLIKIFLYVHIRMDKRKIFRFQVRNLISVFLGVNLLILALLIFQNQDNLFLAISMVILILIDLFFVYYWFSSSVVADGYLTRAKNDEILNTKYKLSEF